MYFLTLLKIIFKNKIKIFKFMEKSSLEKIIFIPLAITFQLFFLQLDIFITFFYDKKNLIKHLKKNTSRNNNIDLKFESKM